MIDVVIFTPTTLAKDATCPKPMGIATETGKLSNDGYSITKASAFDLVNKFE